jgi:hypothetical protein
MRFTPVRVEAPKTNLPDAVVLVERIRRKESGDFGESAKIV